VYQGASWLVKLWKGGTGLSGAEASSPVVKISSPQSSKGGNDLEDFFGDKPQGDGQLTLTPEGPEKLETFPWQAEDQTPFFWRQERAVASSVPSSVGSQDGSAQKSFENKQLESVIRWVTNLEKHAVVIDSSLPASF
jgi:hypothetical protein